MVAELCHGAISRYGGANPPSATIIANSHQPAFSHENGEIAPTRYQP